jgi:choline dehydrogenase-like flavoprotein
VEPHFRVRGEAEADRYSKNKPPAIAAAGCGGYVHTAATREHALTLGLPIGLTLAQLGFGPAFRCNAYLAVGAMLESQAMHIGVPEEISIAGYVPHNDPDTPRPRLVRYEQARVPGGGSSINGQLANRGAPHDYDEWERRGASG